MIFHPFLTTVTSCSICLPTFQLEAPQTQRHQRLSAPPPCPLWFGVRKITWFVPHPWVQLEPFELPFNDFSSIFDPDKLLKLHAHIPAGSPPQRHQRLSAPPPCPLWFGVRKNTWFVPHPWVQLEPFELSFNDFSSIFDPVTSCSSCMPTFQLEAPQRHPRLSAPPCPLWFGVRKNTWFVPHPWVQLEPFELSFNDFSSIFDHGDKLLKLHAHIPAGSPSQRHQPRLSAPPCPLWFGVRKITWFVPHPWVQLEPFELSFNEFSSIFDPDKLLKFMPTFQLEAPQSGICCGSLPPRCPLPLVVWSEKKYLVCASPLGPIGTF